MPTEDEMRLHSCCFTGHRPEKLNEPEAIVCQKLEKEIRQAIADGFNVFITGMSRGVDILAAEIVLRLRRESQPIRLICASPYRGFENRWSADWQRRYNDVLAAADQISFICSNYSPSCFQIRNEWMVNHSARVIAVYDGELGGTKNTVDYACRKGIAVRFANQDT